MEDVENRDENEGDSDTQKKVVFQVTRRIERYQEDRRRDQDIEQIR
jgi:hypothetical protein